MACLSKVSNDGSDGSDNGTLWEEPEPGGARVGANRS